MNKDLNVLILAGGKSSRMKQQKSKIFLKIGPKTFLEHSIYFAKKLNPKNIFVVINKKYSFLEKVYKQCKFVYQDKALGTADAVKSFLKTLPKEKKLLLTYVDTPLMSLASARNIIKKLNKNDLVIYTFKSKKNRNYGLVKKDKSNKIMKIIEYNNATKLEKKIVLCNSGMMGISKKNFKNINNIKKNLSSGEYLITDLVDISYKKKLRIDNINENKNRVIGVNTIKDYKELKKYI